MAELYQRDVRVVAGPLTISSRDELGGDQTLLAMRFDVTKTNDAAANRAKLAVWNLTEENRAKLQTAGLEVTIEAGYLGTIAQLFKGDIDNTTIGRTAVDWVVTLDIGDGARQLKSARINESFRGPQTPGQMLKKAAAALGLDLGNIDEQINADGARSILKEFVSNVVLSGKASEVVDDIAKSLGLTFSVQDKTTQFLPAKRGLAGPDVKLNSASGLLGSPAVGEKNVVTAVSLLNPRLVPGRRVTIESATVNGEFIAQKVQHRGETWGSVWTTTIEATQ